ncbi:hypothetical protein RCL1_002401 [Eukaryota sp. TZLM3-RCL]
MLNSRHPSTSSLLRSKSHSSIPTLKRSNSTKHVFSCKSESNLFGSSLPCITSLEELELIRIIGTGSFSNVYLAQHKSTQVYCALKVMKKSRVIDTRQVQHIVNEKCILGSIALDHPFTIKLLGSFQDKQNVYIVMEFVQGGELFRYLRRSGRFSLEQTIFYAAQVVLVLAHLHQHNTIYRDIKPENILLDSLGYIKLCDFGFAKVIQSNTYTLCGTPEYLAPEVITNRGHSHGVDWWSLGILIYEMLEGHSPFAGDSPYATYEKILAGQIVFPSHFDTVTKDLIRRLLTPDKARRLGCLRNGATDVMNHKFFRNIDWNALLRKKIPAPFVPDVKSAGDHSAFEYYPVVSIEGDSIAEEHQILFKDF